MRRLIRLLALVLCCAELLTAAEAREVRPVKVAVLDPVLELLVQFIGGTNVSTFSVQTWNAHGQLAANRSRLTSAVAAQMPLLALDQIQYAEVLKSTRTKKAPETALYFLLETRTRTVPLVQFYGDPANLPYAAQRVMNALCQIVPEQFSYFQRRLGEFNARLGAVLIAGRKRFFGVRVLCLSEVAQTFLKAFGADVSQPTASEQVRIHALTTVENWKAASALAAPLRDGRLIVTDWHTDPSVSKALTMYAGAFTVRPPKDEDLLFYINEMILGLGSTLEQTNEKR